jgi:hypothetical protein
LAIGSPCLGVCTHCDPITCASVAREQIPSTASTSFYIFSYFFDRLVDGLGIPKDEVGDGGLPMTVTIDRAAATLDHRCPGWLTDPRLAEVHIQTCLGTRVCVERSPSRWR